jgi:hypothetical protein
MSKMAAIREYRGHFLLIRELFPFAPSAKILTVYDLVKIDRTPIDEDALVGFLLERGKDFLLLNLVNPDVVCLNGYCVIRRRDVRRTRVQRKDAFLIRALHLKNLGPSKPAGVSIASWPQLLESVNRHFPLSPFIKNDSTTKCVT